MLTYLKIYGFSDLISKSNEQIKKSLLKIWEEVRLLEEEENIDLKELPEDNWDNRKQRFLTKLFGDHGEKKKQVAFVYDKNPITSAKLLSASLAVAVEHPEVIIFNCSLNKSHRSVCTYYARMFEAKFLIGVIAGVMADDNKVGYLCDYPIYGQIAGINAFALGVQMVNPRAKIYLEWSCVDGAEAAVNRLKEKSVRIISSQDLKSPTGEDKCAYGLYEYRDDKKVNLAMPIWNWGIYYEKLIRSIINKSFQAEYGSSKKAFNYYWGMSAGVVELICSNHLPESVKKLVEVFQNSICNGNYNPFQGIIKMQDGKQLKIKNGALSLQEIIDIDWLLENIEGEIPESESLSEEGRETVKSAGTPKAV